jgi:hypothetical protein
MSKPLAAFYGHKNRHQTEKTKPEEYTVLGINQPLIAPESESEVHTSKRPSAIPFKAEGQRKFRLSLLLNKLL